jgi:hypothetical protein
MLIDEDEAGRRVRVHTFKKTEINTGKKSLVTKGISVPSIVMVLLF